MTLFPARSITLASAGAGVDASLPSAAMLPSRMTIVWVSRAGAPVPSITRACVSAITPAGNLMYGASGLAGGCCAVTKNGRQTALKPQSKRLLFAALAALAFHVHVIARPP